MIFLLRRTRLKLDSTACLSVHSLCFAVSPISPFGKHVMSPDISAPIVSHKTNLTSEFRPLNDLAGAML